MVEGYLLNEAFICVNICRAKRGLRFGVGCGMGLVVGWGVMVVACGVMERVVMERGGVECSRIMVHFTKG